MRNIIDNLNNFIAEQKVYYEASIEPDSQENWNQEKWASSNGNWLSTRDKQILNFKNAKRLKGFKSKEIQQPYIDFCKAYIVFQYRTKRSGAEALGASLMSLKRLYVVLCETTLQSSPIYLTTDIFQKVDDMLVASGYANIGDAAANLAAIQKNLIQHNLTITSLTYKNIHPANNKINSTKKERKAQQILKSKVIDDSEREDEEKLISVEAFVALTWIANNFEHQWEQLASRIIDILLITGMRGNEVMFLPRDCWIEREILNENDGKPIYDSEGNTLKSYGLQYYSEKSSEIRIHWLEGNAVPVAKRAIDDILSITEPYHKHAKWLVETGGKTILPPHLFGDLISSDEFLEYIYDGNAKYNKSKKRKQEYEARGSVQNWFVVRNIEPVKEERASNTAITRYYRRSDVEHEIRKSLPSYDNFLNYVFDVRGSTLKLSIDELLIITPSDAISLSRSNRLQPAVQPIKLNHINRFIGSGKGRSIFEKYGFTEVDGEPIQLTSHMPRHNINTFLALAGLTEHQQTIAMGRNDIQQNATYQHLSIEEKQSRGKTESVLPAPARSPQNHNPTLPIENIKQTDVISVHPKQSFERNIQRAFHALDNKEQIEEYLNDALDAGVVLGELADAFGEIKEKSPELTKEFLETHGYFHIVSHGACSRHVALHGCHKRLKCISGGGCENLHVTGRAGELEAIQATYDNMLQNIRRLDDMYGHDVNYQHAIEDQKQDAEKMGFILEKAREVRSSMVPMQIFPSGANLGLKTKRKTLVDVFVSAMPDKNTPKGVK